MNNQYLDDIVEAWCDDCNYTCFITGLNGDTISHCPMCGGVNVNEYNMRFQNYFDDEYGDVEVVDKYRREDVWDLVKNLNTDDELDEIKRLLFS